MPIESGTYCSYCAPAGELQPFDERFENMVSWQMRQKPGIARAQAEKDTFAFMGKMPAWKNHPRVLAALKA
jgi:hypothetical protein